MIDNTLELELTLAVLADRISLVSVTSQEIPWLEDGINGSGIRQLVESCLLTKLHEAPSMAEIKSALCKLSAMIASNLAIEARIFCGVTFSLILEEHAPESFDMLARKFSIPDGNAAGIASQLGLRKGPVYLGWEQVDSDNASKIESGHLIYEGIQIELMPGHGSLIIIKNTFDGGAVYCEKVRLCHGQDTIAEGLVNTRMVQGQQVAVRVPAVPVHHYGMFTDAETMLGLEVKLRGRDEFIRLGEIVCRGAVLGRSPVVLFLDVGSFSTKMMTLDLGEEASNTNLEGSSLADKCRDRISYAVRQDASVLTLDQPTETRQFCLDYNLSKLPKETLDELTDGELAMHFAQSIIRLAQRFYRREQRLIAEVYWAFPNTGTRDFQKLNEMIQESAGASISGRAHLIAEAECLRHEFTPVVAKLAPVAVRKRQKVEEDKARKKASIKERGEVEQLWREYKQQAVLVRFVKSFFGRRPRDPATFHQAEIQIPTLEKWHRILAAINNHDEFLALDAGGYSLDAYGTFGDTCFKPASYTAGGSKITEAIRQRLAEVAGKPLEEIQCADAERAKLTICEDPDGQQGNPLLELCRNVTDEVYGAVIDDILGKIPHKHGFPVILTGQASRNRFLCRLLEEKLKAKGLKTVPMDARMLYHALRSIPENMDDSLGLFAGIAANFRGLWQPPEWAPATDIIGGLAQCSLRDS
jgi:hypothetical protein